MVTILPCVGLDMQRAPCPGREPTRILPESSRSRIGPGGGDGGGVRICAAGSAASNHGCSTWTDGELSSEPDTLAVSTAARLRAFPASLATTLAGRMTGPDHPCLCAL